MAIPLAALAVPAATAVIGATVPGLVKGAATVVRDKRDAIRDSRKRGKIGIGESLNPRSTIESIGNGVNAAIDKMAAGSDDDDEKKKKTRVLGGQIVHLHPILKVKIKYLSGPATEEFERDKDKKIVETAGLLPMIGGAFMGPVGGAIGSVVENPDAPAHAAAGGLVGGALGEGVGKAVTPLAVQGAQNAGNMVGGAGKAIGEGIDGISKWAGESFPSQGATQSAASSVTGTGAPSPPTSEVKDFGYSRYTPPTSEVKDFGYSRYTPQTNYQASSSDMPATQNSVNALNKFGSEWKSGIDKVGEGATGYTKGALDTLKGVDKTAIDLASGATNAATGAIEKASSGLGNAARDIGHTMATDPIGGAVRIGTELTGVPTMGRAGLGAVQGATMSPTNIPSSSTPPAPKETLFSPASKESLSSTAPKGTGLYSPAPKGTGLSSPAPKGTGLYSPASGPSTPGSAPPGGAVPKTTAPTKTLGQSVSEGFKGAGEYIGKWGGKLAEAATTPMVTGIGATVGGDALAKEGKKHGTTGVPSISDSYEENDEDILERFLKK